MNGVRRSLAVARNDIELLAHEPDLVVIILVMPIVVTAFVKPTYAAVLQHQGYRHANGAEQAVPGMALMFVFFMVSFTGLAFFREYVWNTWDRIRALPVRRSEVMIGKLAPCFGLIAAQQLVLFVVGWALFGLRMGGAVVSVVFIDLAFSAWLVAFILLVIAACATFQQVLVVSNLGGILLAGLGGVLTPISTLPGWAKDIAPVTPQYWAMKGFNHVLLQRQGFGGAVASVGVLFGYAALLAVVAGARFRFDSPKGGVLPGV